MDERDIISELNEIIENSILKNYLDEDVTDISFNGKDLYLQHNFKGRMKVIDSNINTQSIFNFIKKIADLTGKQFTVQNPILDTVILDYRVNAIHPTLARHNSQPVVTMSLRKSSSKLKMKDNDLEVCPKIVYKLLEVIIKAKKSIIICGQTGSGKTELQKYLVRYLDKKDKITLIEDTYDSHIKDLYPNLDINSWITNINLKNPVTISTLVQASLRNNPDWVIVSETRGEEAYHMIQSCLTGHPIITTLHSDNALGSIDRLVHMIKETRDIDELSLMRKIIKHINIVIHTEAFYDEKKKKMIRRIKEIIEITSCDLQGKIAYNSLFKRSKVKASKGYLEKDIYKKLSDELIEELVYKEVDLEEIKEFIYEKD